MFCFLGLKRALAVAGLVGALAVGLVSECTAQDVYGGGFYAAPNGSVYPVWTRFRGGFFPFARRHHRFPFGRFGFGRGEHRPPGFARSIGSRASRFARGPERSTIVPRPDLRRVQVIKRQPTFLPLARAPSVSGPGVGSRSRQPSVESFATPRAPRFAGGDVRPIIAPDLRSVPNRRPSRGFSEPKPQRLVVPQIAAVPLPPRRVQIEPTRDRARPALTDQEKLSPMKAVEPHEHSFKGDQHVATGAQSAQREAVRKDEGRTTNNGSQVVEALPRSPEDAPLGEKTVAMASLAVPSGQKGEVIDLQEPKPDFAQRSVAVDKMTPSLGDGSREARSSGAPAPARSNMAFAVDSPGSTVSVTFLPSATTPEILAFLQHYNLMVADGPSPEGRYRIRLSSIQLPKGLVAQFIKSMRAQTTIVKDVRE